MKNIVVIIGVGSDLGISLAHKFGREGYDIMLMGRDMDKMQKQVHHLQLSGINAWALYIDVTDSESIKCAFSKLRELSNRLELLIYNAVARRKVAPSQLQPEEVVSDFKVNVTGAIACVSQILDDFLCNDSTAIIFTGGGVALNPSVSSASMSISKAALRNYAINLSNELKNKGIFVGIVTITKSIETGTDYAPDIIAEKYFQFFKERDQAELIL